MCCSIPLQFLVSEGQSTTTYAYDSFDQLVRENNQAAGKTWTYAYDDGGKRITKTVNGTTYNYHYLGDQLVELTWGGNKLRFTYDSTGPLSVNCNGTEYFYVKNAQGDVTGLVSASGTRVVTYTYDAWGNLLSTTGTMATTLGEQNPLRYRGYVYDTETGCIICRAGTITRVRVGLSMQMIPRCCWALPVKRIGIKMYLPIVIITR